ncbi:chitin synthase chs-2-like [Zophobas morio]|uniref:chitin synthase chs-2-like n=1 Tax=Zophobas morio TaxID=2755281 RepID=UPI003083113F
MAARQRFGGSNEETEPLYSSEMQEQVRGPWDVFDDPPREPTVGSEVKRTYIEFGVKFLKIVTMMIVFCIVVGAAAVSKGTLLLMTSQIGQNVSRTYCNKDLDQNLQFLVHITREERVEWIWMIMFAFFVPELGTWIRAIRKCLFKHWKVPSFLEILSLCITELCPAVGSAILVYVVLPELDVIKGAMLTNAACFIPGIVAMFSRNPRSVNDDLRMTLDIVSIVAQASSFVIWPLVEDNVTLYMIPVSVILISLGWWENFVSDSSQLPFIKQLAKNKEEFKTETYFIYTIIAPLKCIFFFCTALVIFQIREDDVSFLFDSFGEAFSDRTLNATPIIPMLEVNYQEAIQDGVPAIISVDYLTPIWVWLINIGATYICYAFGKFSCKVMIQVVGFAFPINLSVPVLLSGLIAMCGMYYKDECSFVDTIPAYLFFDLPPLAFLEDFLSKQHAWIWLIWLLSQAWITVHIWSPNCDKLSSTEQLFMRPMYDAFLIDQSLAMNRRRTEHPRHAKDDDEVEVTDLEPETPHSKDAITRIYACGTMWHETDDEMMEFLKSILRLDQDQCCHRIVRESLGLKHDNYYELETHVFFDDAFVRTSKDDNDPHVNEYVEKMASLIDEAASKVHKTSVRIRPPRIYPTPYGGRLVWTLPGKTKMIAHLKDKAKIRAKKRWSQCMYMYYLLGFRLQANDELSRESKEIRGENTYVLALDGDIDFQPEALHLLVDYMKKNKTLGAACGRIHPIGSGGMVWYQMFEYAVGHWMQKATEHVIGCVLCSPGCFSLFRGKALMDKSVMRKYTTRSSQAAHYVQYDQGEDRWLCTLLLQRGYRVEYSAASDAFTHCPEGFNEFYNQRRRWMPSTMANILDLLMDYEHTVKINENISMLYIFYQIILMIGTVIGPGTIFLMLVGAFVAAFGLDQWNSFMWNLLPIAIFVLVCATCSSDIQLFFAGLISAVYGLIMMAVFVGVMLQISEDGFLAPSSLFFFCLAGEFIIAALLHPMEFNCLKYGVVYYVTVPSMYMLLVIYSVFNMNNVSWGTREVTVVPKPEGKEKEQEVKEEKKKPETKDKILTFLGANAEDDTGAFEFSLNKLFKCMFCTYKADDKENEQLRQIQESVKGLYKKLELLEKSQNVELRPPVNTPTGTTHLEGAKAIVRNSLPDNYSDNSATEINSLPSDEVMENSWFYDGPLIRGEVHYLNRREETFWNELIERYLHPIEDDKVKVAAELKDLRDKMVFTFFMLNSLFVLVVFLLTLKKDLLHLNWPIDPKVNFTYHENLNEIDVYITYLELEPIGFVFLIFFALLMVVQFVAMLIHRFGTFQQVITKTRLDFNFFNKTVENMTTEEMRAADPLKMVADLQKLKGINNEYEDEKDAPVDQRKTASNLAQVVGRASSRPVFYLDEAFHRRVTQIGNSEGRVSEFRKKSVAFVQRRMSKAPGRVSSQAHRPSQISFSNGSINEGFQFHDPNSSDADA